MIGGAVNARALDVCATFIIPRANDTQGRRDLAMRDDMQLQLDQPCLVDRFCDSLGTALDAATAGVLRWTRAPRVVRAPESAESTPLLATQIDPFLKAVQRIPHVMFVRRVLVSEHVAFVPLVVEDPVDRN